MAVKRFPGTLASVAAARHWVCGVLRAGGAPAGVVEDAALAVSELAANSVLHSASGGAHGTFGVRVVLGCGRLRVQVEDAGSAAGPPRRGHAEEDDESGRGLALVAYVAREWGALAQPGPPGVFFELAWPLVPPQRRWTIHRRPRAAAAG